MKLLIIEFEHDMAPAEMDRHCRLAADAIAEVPGLVWKLWLSGDEDGRAGAVYLFESEEMLVRYLDGPIMAKILVHPRLQGHRLKVYDLLEAPGRLTRAPVPFGRRGGWVPDI